MVVVNTQFSVAYANVENNNNKQITVIDGEKVQLIYQAPFNHNTDELQNYLKSVYLKIDNDINELNNFRADPCDYCNNRLILQTVRLTR